VENALEIFIKQQMSQIASTNDFQQKYALSSIEIPRLTMTGATSRSVILEWPQEPLLNSPYANCLYQITKMEKDGLKFDIVYEGEDCIFRVDNLKPNTQYKFKLRFADRAEIPLWGSEFVEIQVQTQGNCFL
jgi:hypothetical protein